MALAYLKATEFLHNMARQGKLRSDPKLETTIPDLVREAKVLRDTLEWKTRQDSTSLPCASVKLSVLLDRPSTTPSLSRSR